MLYYTELSKAVAAKTGVTQDVALTIIDGFVGYVVEALADGEELRIAGLGTFKFDRVNASRKVVFQPADVLKSRIAKLNKEKPLPRRNVAGVIPWYVEGASDDE
jgi:nucleoid DNA-binding protein